MARSVRGILAAAWLAGSAALAPVWPAWAAVPEGSIHRGFGGRFAFRTYGEDDGLGNLTVECLLQDRQGFLWVGTQDGLFRFDGRRFQPFGRNEGLPSSRINVVHETAAGELYAGTRDGLAVLAGDRFRTLGPEEGLPRVPIPDEGIASDAGGRLFVGTSEGLFVKAPGEASFRRQPLAAAGPDLPDEVSALHVNRAGELIFARGGRLFRRFSGTTPASAKTPAQVSEIGRPGGPLRPDSERVDQSLTDGAGRLWARTLTRLWVMAPGAAGFESDDAGLPAGVASGRLALDDGGQVMVPTLHGLARRQGGAWRLIGQREGLESATVLSALVDREGSLWIGLAGVGLAQQLGRGAFTAWGSAEGLSHDVVWAIARPIASAALAPPSPLWVGTQEGLDRLDLATGAVRVWKESDGLAGNTVYGLRAGPDGSVWAGSWPGGVTRLGPPAPGREPAVRRYLAAGLDAESFKVATLYFDHAGGLWAGALTGAYRLDVAADFFRPVRLADWDERDSVYGFAEDGAGTLWAAGRHGLQRLTGPRPRRFGRRDGFAADFLSSIVAAGPRPGDRDPLGELIVGYRESLGAARVKVAGDRLAITPINTASSLSFDKVLLLGRDALGALWIGGGAGVDRFSAAGLPSVHFGRAGGLITEDMSQNAFLAEPDGTVWLGTSRGLVRYHPGVAAASAEPPPILLTEVQAGDRRLDPARGAALGRCERNLRIAWASPTFLEPRKLRFRYRLAGLDEREIESAANEARFAALPTGSYRFEVRVLPASLPGGAASARPAVFAFTVLPAWWESWWARSSALLLLAMAVVAAIRLRTHALEADRRRLEKAVDERSAELAQAVRELEEASFTDSLTRVRNRRFLTSIIGADAAGAVRAHRAPAGPAHAPPRRADLVVYLLDLDRFKAVNDGHGHHVGDLLLIEVAKRLGEVVRQSDLLVRWGGEEFLVVARAAERGEAWQLALRILEAVGGRPCDLDGLALTITCSIGWAPFPWFPDAPEALSFEQVLTLADRALYVAKREGRDLAVGALPAGRETEVAGRCPGWLQQPLDEGEGHWVRLVRTRAGVSPVP